MSHAYSILAPFTIVDAGVTWKLLLARNPWGVTFYKGDWDYTDARWTTENLAKIPYGLGDKVKARGSYDGLFVIPFNKVIGA
jgi:hypothetical protein